MCIYLGWVCFAYQQPAMVPNCNQWQGVLSACCRRRQHPKHVLGELTAMGKRASTLIPTSVMKKLNSLANFALGEE